MSGTPESPLCAPWEGAQGLDGVYDDLFKRRQEGDYVYFVRFQADQVRPWIPQTEAFIAHMRALLSKDDPPGS